MVSKGVVEKIMSHVARRFPELSGVKPEILESRIGPREPLISALAKVDKKLVATLQKTKAATGMRTGKILVARFEKEVITQRGDRIRKIVKVSFTRSGVILKTVVSK